MKKGSLICGILAVIIFVSFFLPWMKVESPMVGTLTKVLTGKSQSEITRISGFDIPILANGPDARLMISIIKIFNPNIKNADKKAWLIWSIPLFAIIIFLLSLAMMNKPWFNLAIGIIGILIFVIGAYKIKTTDLDKLVLNVRIAVGVWLTLWSFLGLGLTGTTNFIKSLSGKKGK
jgi:hypothetical protein